MSKITTDEIKRLGALSKLELTEDEVQKFQTDIEAILGFIDELKTVDVSDYEPTDQVTGLVNVVRADKLEDLPSNEDLLKDIDLQDNQFVVEKVL